MKQRLLTIGGLIVGLGLFIGMIFLTGPQRCWTALQQAGVAGVFSFFGLLFLQLVFFTLGWQSLLRGAGFSPPIHWTGICQFMGYTGNNMTPSMYLGGEPVAAYFLARKENLSARRVMGTMVTSKFMQLFAFLILFFTGSYFILSKPETVAGLPDRLLWVITLLKWVDVAAGIGSILLLILVFSGKNALTGLTRILARINIFPYSLMRIKPKIRGMEQTIHQAFQKSWRDTILCFLYSIGAMLTIYARPIVYFSFVPANQTAFDTSNLTIALVNAAAFFTLSQIVQALQFTPAGLGIFDAASVLIFYHVFGILEQYGMGFNIVYRLADFMMVSIGAFLIFKFGAAMFLKEKPKV